MYTELDLFFLIYSAGRQLRRLNLLVLSTFSVVKLRWNIKQASCPKKIEKLHSTPLQTPLLQSSSQSLLRSAATFKHLHS